MDGFPNVNETLSSMVKTNSTVDPEAAVDQTAPTMFNVPTAEPTSSVVEVVNTRFQGLEKTVEELNDTFNSNISQLSTKVVDVGARTEELSKFTQVEKEQDDKTDGEYRRKQSEDISLVRADIRSVKSSAEGTNSTLEQIQSAIARILSTITQLKGGGEDGEKPSNTGGDIESLSSEFSGLGKTAAIAAAGGTLALGGAALAGAFGSESSGEDSGGESSESTPSMGAGGSSGGAGASGSWEAAEPKKASVVGSFAKVKTSTGQATQVNAKYAKQFQGLINDIEATGYKIKSLGGFADRNARGSSKKSYHALGAAIDINPAENPMGKKLITDMPSGIAAIAKKHGLGWGGNWKSVKDAMHFSAAKSEGGSFDISRSDVAPIASPTKGPKPAKAEETSVAETESNVDGHQHDEQTLAEVTKEPETGGTKESETGGELAAMSQSAEAPASVKPTSTTTGEAPTAKTESPIMSVLKSIARSQGINIPEMGMGGDTPKMGMGGDTPMEKASQFMETASGVASIVDSISPDTGLGKVMSQIQSQVGKAQRAANSRTAQNLMQVFAGSSKPAQKEQPPRPPVLSAFNPKYMMQPRV